MKLYESIISDSEWSDECILNLERFMWFLATFTIR